MAYSADSFIAGEQPTTAKWNKLWANDASFNDGTGIATNAVAADKLATNAISLGTPGAATANQTVTSNGTQVDVTNATITVTVPAGGRSIEITGNGSFDCATASTLHRLQIREGATVIKEVQAQMPTAGQRAALQVIAKITPSAGSHTYKLTYVNNQVGAATSYADANARAEIDAKAV